MCSSLAQVKRAYRKKRGRGGRGLPGGGGAHDGAHVSPWRKFVHTSPRFELFVVALAFQGVAESTSATFANEQCGTLWRGVAAAVFLAYPVGFLYYVHTAVSKKVRHEHRAALVRENGYNRWRDQPPMHAAHGLGARGGRYYSGFVDAYGYLFEARSPSSSRDSVFSVRMTHFSSSPASIAPSSSSQDFKDTAHAVHCLSAMLLHRLLIGAIIGGMHAKSKLDDATVAQVEGELVDEEVNGSVLQTSLLICVSGFLLGYIVYVRPYLVPLANFFEALIVLAQVICLFMNFFFIDEGGVFGIELRPEVAARVIYYTMMTSVACLLLRMIAVMLPTPVMILQRTFFVN